MAKQYGFNAGTSSPGPAGFRPAAHPKISATNVSARVSFLQACITSCKKVFLKLSLVILIALAQAVFWVTGCTQASAFDKWGDACVSGLLLPVTVIVAASVIGLLLFFGHRSRKNAKISLDIEKADKDRLMAALAQGERERIAMHNIQAALGSGPWSMEFDEQANIVACAWTDTFRKMLGYEGENDFPNELASWSDLLHEDDKDFVLGEYWSTVRDYTGRKTYDVRYRLLTKNAGWRWFHAAGRLSRRKDGSPISFVGFFVDIDDNKKLEAQLEAQRKDLEDALAAAQYASQAKTKFLNSMSHDIRTPMNAIIGFTALAASHLEDREKVAEYLKKISTSSKHLLSLINDVLDMSRIESGKVKIEENMVSLPEIMHDIKTIVQGDIASRRLEFYIDTLDVVDENVICDKLRLNQVLLNLLSNAIKFTNPGGMVSVRIQQKKTASAGFAAYEFQVKDTGIGIGPEFLESIFTPFERERTSTMSGIPGTGLGMAITKNIVDMMGGHISVSSIKGQGTTFTVSLQFRTCPSPGGEKRIPALEGLRALVVDDDFNTCSSVTRMLSDIGMHPDWTTSGKEAVLRVKVAREQNSDYVVYIIDWLMPDMNGVEVVRRIRAIIGNDTPIIILTAYDWADIEEEARKAGVTAFCAKPIFMSELRALLGAPLVRKQQEVAREQASFRGKKVLLVEDNEMNQEIALEILGKAGLELDVADNGASAVERIKNAGPGRYDLVLMDIQMPIMNGYEATRQIRALDNRDIAAIPIIAMTADAFDEDKKLASEAGMNAHVSKPIDFPRLLQLLDKILNTPCQNIR